MQARPRSDLPSMPDSSSGSMNITASGRVRLSGRALTLARAGWLVLVGFILCVFLVSIPVHFAELRSVEFGSGRAYYLLTPAEDAVLMQLGISTTVYAIWLDAFALLMLGGYVALGVLIFVRRSDSWLAMFMAFTVIAIGVTYNTSIQSLATQHPEWRLPVSIVQACGLTSVVVALFILPDGRFVPRWTRVLAVIWAVYVVGMFVLFAGTQSFNADTFLSRGWTLSAVVIVMTGLASQLYRYRQIADARERQQVRWVVFGLFIAIVGFSCYVLPPYLFPQTFANGAGRVLLNLIAVPLFVALPSLMVPLTMTLAIMRHRLLGVEFILNRALVITALTGILGLIYFIGVVALQQILQIVTGGTQSTLAITISTLVIAALFQPVRRRLQTFVTNQFVVRQKLDKRSTSIIDMPRVATEIGRLSGQQIGAYAVDGLIGQGGMAEVYRAHHVSLKREAAIKALSPTLALDADFRRRFEREAQTIATLQHPNIVQVFDFGESNGNFYMAMAFIPGETLAAYLSRCGRVDLQTALHPLQDIAAALDYAHAQGVIHRDVKPSNVMLQPISQDMPHPFPYRAILTDFGLARLTTGAGANTHTGVMGTLSYIAPEQILNAKHVGHAVDIYALGVITHQLLTGHTPFQGESIGEILMAHLQQTVQDPRLLAPELSASASAAILRALAKQPEDRYATAGEFVAALKE
jgi:tRNA A-37 threonylcarbamoyl transferase component Bud32